MGIEICSCRSIPKAKMRTGSIPKYRALGPLPLTPLPPVSDEVAEGSCFARPQKGELLMGLPSHLSRDLGTGRNKQIHSGAPGMFKAGAYQGGFKGRGSLSSAALRMLKGVHRNLNTLRRQDTQIGFGSKCSRTYNLMTPILAFQGGQCSD